MHLTCIHVIWALDNLLGSSKNENVDHVINVKEMKMKFDELWRKWYLWLSLAVVLDPRYKFRFLDSNFTQIFGNVAKRYNHEVRGKMYELFLQYSFYVDDEENGERFNQINSDLQLDIQGSVPTNGAALNYTDELSELIGYLEAELVPQNAHFDILMWWKDNAVIYPTLAKMACNILAISGCAASIESALDENDARVSLFNQKMSPDEVEALICTQDWISSSEISD
ncbi:hypothetical protein PR202_gb25414 [Eleusine coracana subsp. coracana]|uniref:HAT C-terminal dimerisation domain-containing protein n=1 Tax=Eleusine coracana subsp. coracana TaxID=191504 RepID=A0AAV5FNW6_ELECO|nr:hypothetical protein PR202_gb25414 [Eleusine coracana subsp. coracana]